MRALLALTNALRTLLWRCVLAIAGGRMGRRVTIQPRVCLACRRGHPIALGDGVRLMRGVVLSTSAAGRIELEDEVYVGEYGVVTSNASITVGRHTIIAPHVDLVDFNHRFDDPDRTVIDQPLDAAPIRIGRDCWIGAGVQILAGVTIGDGAVIGAGAVVTRDVPRGGVAVGVPARVVRRRGEPEGEPS